MNTLQVRITLAATLVAMLPIQASAQAPLELLRSIRQGGGWLAIPVREGTAVLRTDTIPTFGLAVNGCLTVWPGHSGTWSVEARDPLNEQSLEALVRPGEGVRFSYQTGTRSALGVQVRWSEPRDTVLRVWVGVETGDPDRDACTPKYRGSGGGGAGLPESPESPAGSRQVSVTPAVPLSASRASFSSQSGQIPWVRSSPLLFRKSSTDRQ